MVVIAVMVVVVVAMVAAGILVVFLAVATVDIDRLVIRNGTVRPCDGTLAGMSSAAGGTEDEAL